MSAGIGYSLGTANNDPKTGIHFGCISLNSLAGHVWDDVESIYPDTYECIDCGDVYDDSDWEKRCKCGDLLRNLVNFAEPIGQDFGAGLEYSESLNCLFVTDSEFYTFGNFCSPCAPGAVDLDSPNPNGAKAYCLGFDWFDNESPCPYPVYSVKTGERVWEELTRDNTELEFWAERDRMYAALKDLDGRAKVEFWDEAVDEAITDGFIPSSAFIMEKLRDESALHTALIEYAKERGLR